MAYSMSLPVHSLAGWPIMRGRGVASTALALIFLTTGISAASATVTQGPAPATIQVISDGGVLSNYGSSSYNYCASVYCFGSSSSASANLTASSSGFTSGQIDVHARASASIFYEFIVHGPAQLVVPVHINGRVAATAYGDMAQGVAKIEYYDVITGPVDFQACAFTGQIVGACVNTPTSATLNADFSTRTDYPNFITLSEGGEASSHGGFTAFVDPVITIDSAFLAANPGYSLSFSPNIGGSVPEPATWAMMILGFGLCGTAFRRQRVAISS